MSARNPIGFGDGRRYTNECLCCGVIVTGMIVRSRPMPYLASRDPFGGGKQEKVILIQTDEGGVHDIPLKGARIESHD